MISLLVTKLNLTIAKTKEEFVFLYPNIRYKLLIQMRTSNKMNTLKENRKIEDKYVIKKKKDFNIVFLKKNFILVEAYQFPLHFLLMGQAEVMIY
jgi:hypothetical protein